MPNQNSEKTDYAPMRRSLEKQMETLNRQLDSLRAEVRAGSESSRGSFAEPEDRAADTSNLEDTLTREEHLVDELSEVNIALEKLAAGTYGKCDRCGCSIRYERLLAVPTTRFCYEDATVPGSAKSCLDSVKSPAA
jgi:RNA polymerase-binding transcription factor DksA